MNTWASGCPAGDRVPAAGGVKALDGDGPGLDGVVSLGDVVERAVVLGAAADLVDGGVDEAQVPTGVLVGQGHDPGPGRRGRAGADGRKDAELTTGGLDEGDTSALAGVG